MIFMTSLYVAAEFAIVATRRTRISQMAAEGNRMAQALIPIVENSRALDNYVAACQVGITISSLVLGAYGQNAIALRLVEPLGALIQRLEPVLVNVGINATAAVAEAAAHSIAVTGTLIVLTILQVVIGELFPKSVAIQYPENVALAVLIPMRWSLALFRPFIWFFNGNGRAILRLLGRAPKDKPVRLHSPEEIELLMAESHEGGLLDDRERVLLRNAFRLRDLTARQVMVHRTRLMAASVDSSVKELMTKAIEAGFSRIPVYQESIDDIIGFVHVKDLFRLYWQSEEDIHSIIREVVYVPETLPAAEVWEILNTRRKYLAVVFDEYGGTAGLISFEDLIEEIFGELQDEFDNEMALISRDKEGRIYLRGDLLVTDVNEYLDLDLPTDVADTLGGLVFSELGRPPVEGDEVRVDNVVICVEAVVGLSVSEVSLQLPLSNNSIIPFTAWEVADHE
jgi:CBS domain containing-hemolysin-like protein